MLPSIDGMASRAAVIDTNEQLAALAHPLRLRILDELRAPGTAAGAARRIGESRQLVNHHVRALAKVGLVRSAGERRNGNFVEQLYESIAGTFVLSPRLTWGDGGRARTLVQQVPLRDLVEFGERLQRAAAALLDRAAFDGEAIPSAVVETTIRFADAADRAAFLEEFLASTAALVDKYASRDGDAYSVGLVVHPTPNEDA